MSTEEQKRVLKMVEDGKISAEEANALIKALEETSQPEIEIIQPAPGKDFGTDDPNLEEVVNQVRTYWHFLLWIGVGLVLLSTGLMYWAIQASGYGFWFYCTWLPMLLGLLVLVMGSSGQTARWLYVRVQQKKDWPGIIVFGFPLPLRFISWILRTFASEIPEKERETAAQVLEVLEVTSAEDGPLLVNVDDDEDGNRVQVFIG
ncbi:MAG: hypothetical protein JXA13_08830 [Anaerolineales bacterium]|nr:hypothetical protein [Anaerolineales bacterium]